MLENSLYLGVMLLVGKRFYIPPLKSYLKFLKRKSLLKDYFENSMTIAELSKKYKISVPRIYVIINKNKRKAAA